MTNKQLSAVLGVLLLIFANFSEASYIYTAPVGGAMGGASNCPTTGSVPFVLTAGVLTCDATNFFWDNSNKRLGLGTNAPAARLEIKFSNPDFAINNTGSGTGNFPQLTLLHQNSNRAFWYWDEANSTNFFLANGNSNTGTITFSTGGSVPKVRITSTSVGIGPNNVTPTNTVSIYDATVTTGVTAGSVRAGAGQSTTDLWQWLATNGTTVLGRMTSAGRDVATLWGSETNCSSSASPAVCAAAPAGSVVVAAAATTVVVNTTAVTANSQILITFDSSLSTKLGVTCNATIPTLYGVSARTAGTSFTLTATASITDPSCWSYVIIN